MKLNLNHFFSDQYFYFLLQGSIEFQGKFDDLKKLGKHYTQSERKDSMENPSIEDYSREKFQEKDADAPLNVPISPGDESKEEPKETEELVAKGNVSNSLYWKYFRASHSFGLIFLLLIIIIIAQLLSSGSDFWLAVW